MYTTASLALILLPVLGVISVAINILRYGRRDKRLPPGPRTVPIFGNALQIPGSRFPQKLKEWADEYGGIYSLKVGASTMIILNDRRAVHQLVDKKSAMYGDRPFDRQWEIALGEDINFSAMHATPTWRSFRKIAAQMLSPKSIDDKIAPGQEAEICKLTFDLLETPERFFEHIKRVTASTASTIIYGHRAKSCEDYWCSINPTLKAGSYLPVEHFPILKLIPERFLESRKRARNAFSDTRNEWNEARRRVETRRTNGDLRNSLADQLFSGNAKTDFPLSKLQQDSLLGTLYGAGSDTTSNSMLSSILHLAKYPEFQAKARTELDRVCGTERMPQWSDFADCPYINCIVKEGQRIRSVAPLGLAHRVNCDDWFDGMLIPKDATIFIPPYVLNRTLYENSEEYNPDRYLNHPRLAMDYAGSPDYMNRDHYSYGAGKRICVGIHLAERTQWRVLARLLWAFKIEPAIDDETGFPVPLDTSDDAYGEGLLSHPLPYKVRFTPRSEKHVQIIREEYKNAEEYLSKWD
ncbi:cytochrome P450 2D18 [Lophiostoma macrostomum CBS 122681]|uniref:Cytochrome P450 2D18 n=1 Tax=Lophiostoma macrostomum CBS 122681 TaxID=1314788 RepID=A0A6A6SYJ2_9PLEO|nr:cytochrome P450 2D18 [Lophiostoma macrostomum CBS 122681]